jgi:nitroimidazol reductase NimA-like FMN-containing flavoprotein (pyridoxamine 5'-phosphate oxidase superfamily)
VAGEGTDRDRALVVLPAEECHRLLATRQLGRIGLVGDPFPLILPVNYVLDGDVVVIRTGSSKITAAAHRTRVAFEVDDVDERTRTGWSVLVQALAEEVTGAGRDELVARLHAASGSPWAPGEHGHWIRLTPEVVTGRRIVPGQLPPPFEDSAYL